MVSIAAMIAPSPDWCAMAANVVLYQEGQWLAEKTVALEAWDMGTDSATSYRALDQDTPAPGLDPAERVAVLREERQARTVGSVKFVRQ